MKSLKNLLGQRKDIKKTAFSDKDVFYIFQKIISEEFGNIGKEKFRLDYFGKKVLIVKCGSSVWAGELWSNRKKIIRKMNEELGEGAIREVKTK